MNNKEANAKVIFRFLKLDKLQAITLTHEIKGSSYIPHDKGRYEGSIELEECYFEDLITFFVRQQIPLSACDILVSVASQQTGTFATPMVVNKMLKHIDCQITFAYPC
ncbi:hypothetical protein QX776_08710 [Alteromonadaceae bacterium BrNp21-10]|nr:hypothetical protein [Alteromonadaceae bacterium BrNp21-10]